MTIDGTVVDANGSPVTDADVFLTGAGPSRGLIVAHSDLEGRFELRGIRGSNHIGARKPGFAPSPLIYFPAAEPSKRLLRLVLGEPAGEITGRVLSPQEEPVSNALVRVMLRTPEYARYDEEGVWGTPTVHLDGRTDAQGLFRITSVPPGRWVLRVRAAKLARWRGYVNVSRDVSSSLEIRLAEPARVAGTIATVQGIPARQVVVRVKEWFDDVAPPDGMEPITATDIEGHYVLECLPPGSITLEADGDERGRVSATLTLAAGEQVEWNVTLKAEFRIAGRLLDEDQQPLAGWAVDASPASGFSKDYYVRSARTDASGRFLLPGLQDVPHEVSFSGPNAHVASLQRHDLRPSREEIVLILPRECIPSVFISGRAIDPQGNGAGGVKVSFFLPEFGSRGAETTESGTGRFALGPLLCGSYDLRLSLPGVGETVTKTPELQPGERFDAGEIQLSAPTRVVFRVRDSEGLQVKSLRVRRTDAPLLGETHLELTGKTASLQSLAPGPFAVIISGPGVARESHAFELREGEEKSVEIVPRPGSQVTLQAQIGNGQMPMKLVVIDANGALLFDDRLGAEASYSTSLTLASGTYTALVSTVDSRHQSRTTFSVAPGLTEAFLVQLNVP
ncbi:MAG: carboxypeptidase regulatory-like domain-containing protein [Planctomycetota bacterium]